MSESKNDFAVGIKLSRTICATFAAMRACDQTRNYAPMVGLIEEAQIYANKMEAGLEQSKEAGRKILWVVHAENMSDKKKIAEIKAIISKRWDLDFNPDGSVIY